MIVEGQGMGFWTRVRLPPTPLNESEVNARVSPLEFSDPSEDADKRGIFFFWVAFRIT